MHWNQKNYNFFSYYPSQNFALWQKIAMTQNFYPIFFYSLDPPLSEFKVKFRGHPFAYTLTNTATGLLRKSMAPKNLTIFRSYNESGNLMNVRYIN